MNEEWIHLYLGEIEKLTTMEPGGLEDEDQCIYVYVYYIFFSFSLIKRA